MIRLYVDGALTKDATLAPSEDQTRYLLTVMRCKAGDLLLLFNGRDGEWEAAVEGVSKRTCSLCVKVQTRPQVQPPDFELIMAVVKRPRLETIIEKAVELGAARVRLLITRRTNQDRANLARLHAIAVEASEQTGRLDVPEILAPQTLETLLTHWPPERILMYCDEAGDDPQQPWGGSSGRACGVLGRLLATRAAVDPSKPAGGRAAWGALVGPEGGFSPEERLRLRAHPGVVPVSLGPRILRADTAAICAMALWQAALGDWVELD